MTDLTLPNTIQLIAFDLDGTLANTEALSLPSAVETMRQLGVPVTLEYWYEHLHGLAGQALMDTIQAQFGVTVNFQEYLAHRSDMVPQMFANGVQPAPGMLQALRHLVAAGHQVCVCSNSMPERIGITLLQITGQHSAGINLANLFEGHIYSATGSKGEGNAKPAPDVYLKAAQAYRAAPNRCIAVEDSPVGVTSAVAAGFTCLGYTGLSHKGEADARSLEEAGAHHTFHHWDDFIPLLATLKI